MKFKERPKSEKTRIIITTSIIILFVLISVLAGVIFPGSGFANIIDNSIGKFFQLIRFCSKQIRNNFRKYRYHYLYMDSRQNLNHLSRNPN